MQSNVHLCVGASGTSGRSFFFNLEVCTVTPKISAQFFFLFGFHVSG